MSSIIILCLLTGPCKEVCAEHVIFRTYEAFRVSSCRNMVGSLLQDPSFSRLRWCYANYCKVSASDLLWARQACWINFRVKFKFFNFTSPPDISPVPNVAWLPLALSASYSDSESCSGHVFSMLSLQSNSGAGQKRPQARRDTSMIIDV